MESQQKIILVTGGTGLVGSALQEIVKQEPNPDERWIFLSSKDGDLTVAEETEKIFKTHKPTHVVHLAAVVGGVFANMSNNLDFFRKNILINDNVLQKSFETGVVKVVSCLSTCIFPEKTKYPIDESMVNDGPPHISNYGYSYAKRMIDILNRAYKDKYNRNYTSVIPCNVFGPRDNYNTHSSHVIPALIRRMYETVEAGKTSFTVLGSGKPLRQFIYSLDLAKLMIWVLRHYDEVSPLILAVDEGDEVTISQAASAIAKAFNFKGDIVYDTSATDGQYKKTASNSKLRRFLPDFKFTPFEEAIRDSVQWYIDNVKVARN